MVVDRSERVNLDVIGGGAMNPLALRATILRPPLKFQNFQTFLL
nr:MAG TPA: hypothetical protein [Caudoviricetes sp.]